ncbi:hypothetical protein H3N91_000223 [Salmonella enterica]|nr:hypothetical protein [Salmonella enterica]EEA2271407.1 hypothetical protein [Salmonella enterica]EFV5114812.1 hypothetical protein [Salmonella enterica]EGB7057512.1 hypothetical protein [Salmonella enterica]EGO6390931.1 hypothetical protein [Salmonella enterica]
MKRTLFALTVGLVLACGAVTGCSDRTAMRQQHAQEDQVLAAKHQADRKLARAQDESADTALLSEIAAANLAAKQKQEADASAKVQAQFCQSSNVSM